MRNLERWLHQHLFKVGWLVTKNLRTTTILYYTFFLPGLILNQVVYWLAAGIVNVQAKRAIQMPQAQDVAQLRLDFIQLDRRRVSALKLAVISIAPLLAGIAAIWFIWHNILNIDAFVLALGDGSLDNLPGAIRVLTSAPDFWLWIYITFTIGNTMMPDFKDLRGWRIVLIVAGVALAALFVLGAGDEVTAELLAGPVANALGFLAAAFAFIVAADVLMVAILGALESTIERITGDSATFDSGKLVTLTRAELLERRKQEAAKRERQEQQKKKAAEPAGPPSIYRLPFPIPDAPGRESLPDVAARLEEPARTPLSLPEDKPTPTAAPIAEPPKLPEVERGAPLITGMAARRSAPVTEPAADADIEDEAEELEEEYLEDEGEFDSDLDEAQDEAIDDDTLDDDDEGDEEAEPSKPKSAIAAAPKPAFLSGSPLLRPSGLSGSGTPPTPPGTMPPRPSNLPGSATPSTPPTPPGQSRPNFPSRPRPSILTPNIPPRPPDITRPASETPPKNEPGDDQPDDDEPHYEPFDESP